MGFEQPEIGRNAIAGLDSAPGHPGPVFRLKLPATLPLRLTRAFNASILPMAAMACSALPSWMNPMAALMTNNRGDDGGISDMPQQAGRHSGHQKCVDEHIMKLRQETQE